MKLENAIVVNVDFDGDIKFEESGTSVFTGDYGEVEAMGLVRRALAALDAHAVERNGKHGRMDVDFGENVYEFELDKAIANGSVLKAFMLQGGSDFGNHSISVDIVGEKYEAALLA